MRPRPASGPKHQSRYGIASCAMFVVAVVLLLIGSTFFDSSLGQLSLSTQRWIGAGTLVLPATIGVVLGGLGLRQADRKKALAIVGLICNSLFALFFAAVLSFAG